MFGKLSTIGAVAAIPMMPAALSAQVGGALATPAVPFASLVVRGIPGPNLGTWRSPSFADEVIE